MPSLTVSIVAMLKLTYVQLKICSTTSSKIDSASYRIPKKELDLYTVIEIKNLSHNMDVRMFDLFSYNGVIIIMPWENKIMFIFVKNVQNTERGYKRIL